MGMDMSLFKMKDKTKWNLDCGDCEHWIKYKKSVPKGSVYCDNVCETKCAWWNDTGDNFKKLNLVPKDNPYLKGWICWGDEEYELINIVVAKELNVNINFTGDPICKQEDFDYAVDMLNKWYNEKCNGRTKFIIHKEWGYSKDWEFEIPNVDKLVEYLTTAKENGFTMWFSF